MKFEEYNGWPNFPSWDIYTAWTSYYETYQELERIVKSDTSGRKVQRFIMSTVDAWKSGRLTGHEEAVQVQIQDFLMNGVRRINWTLVYDVLRGNKPSLGETDELTALAYNVLQPTDWRSIVAGAQYLTEADERLRDWLENQCVTWVESVEARAYQSQVALFVNKVLEVYYGVVDWQHVASALRGE